MRNIHVTCAYILGVLLPLLETIRRKDDFSNLAIYIDDYIIGGLLIFAAYSVKRGKDYGQALLTGVWGMLCGGLYYSFTGQFLIQQEVSGLPNMVIITIKGLLFLTAILLFIRSISVVTSKA